jgi:hypothetical protein
MGALNVHTRTITGSSITVTSMDNVVRMSVICASGTITVRGSASFQGTPSSPVDFTVGEGITITSPSITNPIDGVTVDATGGAVDLVLSTQ